MKRRKSAYAPPADARGASADRFRTIGPLGDGGTLHEAEQLATGRRCALRVLSPKLVVGDDALRDFEDIRGLRAKMNTAHIVELLDAGVDATTGAPWLALDFLDGDTLAERAARGMTRAETLDALTQVAHAVTAARGAGAPVVTLDPARMIVTKGAHAAAGFSVVLEDFWVRRWAADAADERPAQTPRDVLWTAPEALEALEAQRDIDESAEVWSFALLAFDLLTGVSFWRSAETGPEATVTAALKETAAEVRDAASERARALGRPSKLPEGFNGWFARCLADDATQRFSTVRSALDALAPMLRVAAPSSSPSAAGRARSLDYAVPALLALVLVIALPVRAAVKARRARAAAAVPAAPAFANAPVVTNAPAVTPTPAPGTTAPTTSAPGATPDAGPPRVDDETLAALQQRLAAVQGAPPVWIAVAAADPAAMTIAERLQTTFQRAGWRTHPITRSEVRARPGLFVFAADETPPSYVDDAIRALGNSGIVPTTATGYRAYYEERHRASPDFKGFVMAGDQTYVIAVGRGQ